ncbi:MAG TPA: hypothetical protein VFJ43_13410, partial [Bacteroidia bacterium]|nr:hypothetical protein [Bacteroidia bacterium]
MLTGLISIDHTPIADQQVLIISEKTDSILFSGKTDEKGEICWKYSEELNRTKVYLLVKFRTDEVVSAEFREISLPQKHPFNIDINTNELEEMNVTLQSDSGFPKRLLFSLEALSMQGIPAKLLGFLDKSDNHVSGSFYSREFTTNSFSLKVRKGNYRISGKFIIYDRHEMINPDFNN